LICRRERPNPGAQLVYRRRRAPLLVGVVQVVGHFVRGARRVRAHHDLGVRDNVARQLLQGALDQVDVPRIALAADSLSADILLGGVSPA
jgi:hypothetical protein